MFKQAWTWLRKLPVARWVKPIWKGALKEAVNFGFTWLRAEARRIEGHMPGEFKALATQWSAKCKGWVKDSPLPDGIEDKIANWIDTETSILIRNVDKAGEKDTVLSIFLGGVDTAESILLARIESL